MSNLKKLFYTSLAVCIFMVIFTSTTSAADFDKPVEYAPIHVDGLEPENISIKQLKSGLSAVYFLEYFERNLDSILTSPGSSYNQVKGAPILEINHQFGKEEVFDSGTNRGVAMRMSGYLHLTKKGDYEFQALSNDGVRVLLAGKTVISDHEQHSDRLSNIGYVAVDQPGYYKVMVEYFQRKGTAALKLLWKPPHTKEFVPIPQNAYVHLP